MSDAMNHDRAFELLPWLANGTLEADEHDRVESHVRGCLTCRAELKEQRTLHALVREHPTVHLSAEQSFAQWDDGPRFRRAPSFAAAAAAAIVAIGAGVWFGGMSDVSEDPDYRSLSTDAESGVVHLDIIFADGTTEEQMRGLLADMEGTIVGGPSALGRYRVRLEPSGPGESQVDDLVRSLLIDERVRFAGQSFMDARPE
jgi:hypothetical protein